MFLDTPNQTPVWDLVASSDAFATFCGVLAALMFGGVILLLVREPTSYNQGSITSTVPENIAIPITFMFGSMFSLIVAAFLFAAIKGLVGFGPAAFVFGIMPSLALGIGVVQMAVGMAWLFQERGLAGPPLVLGWSIVWGVIVVVSFFLTGVAVAPWFLAGVGNMPYPKDSYAWLAMTLILCVSFPIGQIIRWRLEFRNWSRRLITSVNVSSLVVVVAAAVGWQAMTGYSSNMLEELYASGVPLLWAGVALVFLLFLSFGLATPRAWGLKPDRRR